MNAGSGGSDRFDVRMQRVLDDFDARVRDDDPDLQSTCHQAMHIAGRRYGASRRASAVVYPRNPERLCASGFAHGIVEGQVEAGAAIDVREAYRALCVTREAASACAHGLGHSLLVARLDDGSVRELPVAVELSADDCDELARHDSAMHQRADDCLQGVYMERSMRAGDDIERLVEECRATAEPTRRRHCALFLTIGVFEREEDADRAAAACNLLGDDLSGTCAEGLGNLLGPWRAAGCHAFPAPLLDRCYVGSFVLGFVTRQRTAAEANRICSRLREADCRRAVADAAVIADSLRDPGSPTN